MNEPERLSMVSDSDFERLLLRAGRAGAPVGARERAMVAAAAALGTAGLAAGSAAASGLATKTGSALSLKWLAVLGLAGLGAMTAAVAIQTRHPATESRRTEDTQMRVTDHPARGPTAPSRVSPVPLPVPSMPATSATPVAIPATATTEAVPSAPISARSAAPAPEPAGTTEPSVHEELGMLEQARSALAAGDAARTLAILDGYAVTFPHPTMAPEATVLRIEALVRAGDTAAARRTADGFLASHPQSPYAERIRTILGGTNP